MRKRAPAATLVERLQTARSQGKAHRVDSRSAGFGLGRERFTRGKKKDLAGEK